MPAPEKIIGKETSYHRGGLPLVSKREVLEELSLPNLQKLADRLDVRVSKGLTGLLTQAMMGSAPESRRQCIEALGRSDLVTLEEIDRILHTRYSRLPDDTRGTGFTQKPKGVLGQLLAPHGPNARTERFYALGSMIEHILSSYVSKPDLQKLCQNLGLRVTGNKSDFVACIANDPGLSNELTLYYVNRDDMKKLCADLRLPMTGTRGDMEARVLGVMARLPRSPRLAANYQPIAAAPTRVVTQPTAYSAPRAQSLSGSFDAVTTERQSSSPHPSPQPASESLSNSSPPSPTTRPEPLPPTPPSPAIQARPDLERVIEFIETWHPSNRFKDESKYEIELAAQLRHRFGNEAVLTQFNVSGGRIDIEVLGIGIELKVPSKVQMQRLVGQSLMYKRHYGPNIVVVIFNDRAKTQDIIAFGNDLRGQGIRVCVK